MMFKKESKKSSLLFSPFGMLIFYYYVLNIIAYFGVMGASFYPAYIFLRNDNLDKNVKQLRFFYRRK